MLMRIWNQLCSLKLAIYLASAATLLLMGGSLLIPFNPTLFGNMDHFILGDWLSRFAGFHLRQTWWFYLAAALMVLFGINTLCCFSDWLWHFRVRWRKSGEYLLHLGVVLVLAAFIWGSMAGWRQNELQCPVGTPVPLPDWPGHYLRVDSFKPIFSKQGPPLDMISQVSLLRGSEPLLRGAVKINQPLLNDGLVVVPLSFGRKASGFMVSLPDRRSLELKPGREFRLANGSLIKVIRFYPDARRESNGTVRYHSDQLGNPAFELNYTAANGRSWRGWYFIIGPLPAGMTNLGLSLKPVKPLFDFYSVLRANYDPGAPLAAVGSGLMTAGVLLALLSFYRKRRFQDRPEI